jgi:carbonic anhydrase/acetyltransferase-like protein (isoleucine patch superfamily)
VRSAVVRGDGEPIAIGRDTNIRIFAWFTDPGSSVAAGLPIGHRAILPAAIGNNTLVGMGRSS